MSAEKVTAYQFQWLVGRDGPVLVDGFADAGVGWQATAQFTVPGTSEAEVMLARSVDESVWMQMRGWSGNAAGCWLRMGDGQVPLGIQAMSPTEPAYISLLGHLSADRFTKPDAMVGKLDLSAALLLLSVQIFKYIHISESAVGRARLPVQMGYDGRRISGVSVAGVDLMGSIEEAGGTVKSDGRTGLQRSYFVVNYPPPKEASALKAPPSRLVMTDPALGCH